MPPLLTQYLLCAGDVSFGQGTILWAATVPPLFCLMMLTSTLALKYVSVGTFVVVRNLGPLVTLVIETFIHQEASVKLDRHTAGATGAIALGVFIYESWELRFSAIGLCFLVANLLFACAERMLQRHLLAVRKVDVSKAGLMALNNGIGMLLSTVLMWCLSPKEAHALYHALRYHPHVRWVVAASCLVGCAISYTGLWLQRLVTATSFMVLGSGTKLIIIVWGIVRRPATILRMSPAR